MLRLITAESRAFFACVDGRKSCLFVLPLLRLAAPSSCRSFVLPLLRRFSLLIGFLLLTGPTHAGTYVWTYSDPVTHVVTYSPTYSGGVAAVNNGTTITSKNYAYTPPTYGGYAGSDSQSSRAQTVTCSGQITATFTWKPDPAMPSDLPPASVVVQQDSTLRTYLQSGTTCTWATGLGQSGSGDASVAETKYRVQSDPGPSFSQTCSPNLTVNTLAGGGGGGVVTYKAIAVPITVRLNGTTKDAAGNDNILIGQGCTAYIQAGSLPSGTVTFSNFAWTPQGPAVFDHFQVAVDNTTAQVVPVASGEWAKPNPHWLYLQDSGAGAYGVACTATVSVNGTALGSVNGRRDVQVWVPYYTFKPLTGPVIVDNRLGYLELYAGGPHVGNLGSNNWYPAGISNGGRVGTPALFRKPDSGSWQFIQLIHPGRWTYYVNLVGSFIEAPLNYNGLKMLDNKLPYPAASNSPSTPWPADSIDGSSTSPTYWMEDSPGTGLSDSNYRYRADETFDDFMMYKPPNNGNGVDWVPLHLFNWKWQADITKSQALWSSGWTPSLPGYVTNISSQRCITHPDWQYLLTNTGMHF